MITDPATALGVMVTAAVASQWIATRLRVPSVLILLSAGLAIGAVVDPDDLLGDLLFPVVSFGVAILLFDGALGLRFRALGDAGQPVVRLVTLGLLATWAVGAAAAGLFLSVDSGIALLIGAIVTVSGPTVIGPILSIVRPREPVASVLRWEGILIDPVGAALAVVVLDAVLEERAGPAIALRVLTTMGAGLGTGAIAGLVMVLLLRTHRIPDPLQVPASLALLVLSYSLANQMRPESGLVAATVLGIVLANRREAASGHITVFSAHLGTTVLGLLFIVLGARTDIGDLLEPLAGSLALAAALVLVARPLAVLVSTLGTRLTWGDRGFLASLAPRGVVAASVASLFAIELEDHGIDPGPMVPAVFTVVVATVVVAGLAARTAALRLRVARPDPVGVALVGGDHFTLALADSLTARDVPVIIVGVEDDVADKAFERGLLVFQGRLDTDDLAEATDLVGISRVVALSGMAHLDRYVTERLASSVGRANVFAASMLDDAGDAVVEPDATITPREILPGALSARSLDELVAAGVGLRSRSIDDDQVDDERFVTVCRIADSGAVAFGQDATDPRRGRWTIELGPLAEPADMPPPHGTG